MIAYEEDWLLLLLFQKDGSVAIRACWFAVPAATIGVLMLYCDEWFPGLREDLGLLDISGSQIWNASTAVLASLLSFRTGQGFARFWEGTGLLHQMRGEWFDTVSNCVTFSIAAKHTKPKEVTEFRHTLVRLMSLCHGSSLEEIAGDAIKLDSIDVFGLDDGTLSHLRECHDVHGFNKVEVMLHLIQSLITRALDDGVMKVPPPIASRVYQTISRGFVNLLNAKKITDTRFPFPYAQLISFLLFLHCVLTPMIISGVIKSKVLCAVFIFIPIFGMVSLNFIASELENPFGTDDNDLPLAHFQEEMNSCLMMLLHTNTDMIATTSSRCITDFYDLLKTMKVTSGEEPADDPSGLCRLSQFTPDFFLEEGQSEGLVPSGEEVPEPTSPTPAQPAAPAPAPSQPLPPPPPPPPPDSQSRLVSNMEDFSTSLQKWTRLLDANTTQMAHSFDGLHAQSVNLVGLLKLGAGWEAAVNPVP